MRNIKTAIAVFICVVIFKIFRMDSPFYAAIAAIIAMQSSVKETFTAGKNRMLGTFVGAIVGLSFALINPENPFLVGIGIVIIICICNKLKWNKSISTSGIVFIAIMVNLNGKSPWTYSLYRTIDTLIGIGVAVAVNYLIFPPNSTEKLIKLYRELKDITFKTVEQRFCLGENPNLSLMNKRISELKVYIEDYSIRFKPKEDKSKVVSNVTEGIKLCRGVYEHLKAIELIKEQTVLNEYNASRINSLYNCSINTNEEMKTEANAAFNYHADRIIDKLYSISRLS